MAVYAPGFFDAFDVLASIVKFALQTVSIATLCKDKTFPRLRNSIYETLW